jgi:hypothetical protein
MNQIPPDNHPTGLLVSQIGYDLGGSMRALYRAERADGLPEGVSYSLRDAHSHDYVLGAALEYWGECWHSHWWVADFSSVAQAGEYVLSLELQGVEIISSQPFKVGEYLLWQETIVPVAIDQFEERARQARFGNGWKDCGSFWREVDSHAAALIGLLDLLNIGFTWLDPQDTLRLTEQIMHGCDFIVLCQKRAQDLGYPPGSIIHELPYNTYLIPQDHGQSVVVLAKTARHIYELDAQRSMDYLNRAASAYEYLTQRCRPYGKVNFSAMLHGAPEGYIPEGFMTGDLLMMVWGGAELARSGRPQYLEEAIRRMDEVLKRQVPQSESEDGLFGHFYTFEDHAFTEKAFTHHHVGHDTGMMFAHDITPILELCEQLPEHPNAPRWRQAVHDFAYGYFLPACRKNPFNLLPQGYYRGQGLLTFAGPWHGMNVCYGYAAGLAAQLEQFFGDCQFREIAIGNLQWIAGLNAGITRDSFIGSVIWQEDIPPDTAVAYSHIHEIGTHAVTTWSGMRGAIGNGYCTNRQFEMAVEPTLDHDGPWRYPDEDWIPHAGGWASGLAFLRLSMYFSHP